MDHAIDHSVLSASSPQAGSFDLPAAETGCALEWLASFRAENGRRLALDAGFALWAHYEAYGDSNHGLLVLREKIDRQSYRMVPVAQSVDGEAMVGVEWAHLDPHRRRLLAIAFHEPMEISVVNATHENWHAARLPPASDWLRVDQLLEDWIDAQVQPADVEAVGAYHLPPDQLEGALAGAVRVGAGSNNRMAWEDDTRRYEFDRQHNTVEVYALGTGVWLHEARLDGSILTTTGGEGRTWGKS